MIGTAVNVAARLEEMTRRLQAQIVMSDDLRGQVMAEGQAPELLNDFTCHDGQDIRGLDQSLPVWSVTATCG